MGFVETTHKAAKRLSWDFNLCFIETQLKHQRQHNTNIHTGWELYLWKF